MTKIDLTELAAHLKEHRTVAPEKPYEMDTETAAALVALAEAVVVIERHHLMSRQGLSRDKWTWWDDRWEELDIARGRAVTPFLSEEEAR